LRLPVTGNWGRVTTNPLLDPPVAIFAEGAEAAEESSQQPLDLQHIAVQKEANCSNADGDAVGQQQHLWLAGCCNL